MLAKNQVPQKIPFTISFEGHSSPVDWARELFKPSEDVESSVFTIKKWEVLDFRLIVGYVIWG